MIGIGIVGLGKAARLNAPAVLRHPAFELVAGADVDAGARDRFSAQLDLPAVTTVEELCAHPGVDAVWVTTPHQWHRAHVEAAARAGKHVIVEKPMALDLADCSAMIDAVTTAGVALIVGHTEGFAPAITTIRSIVDSAGLGALRMMATWNYDEFLYRRRRPEELRTETGGGIVFNAVPHHVEIFRTIAGNDVRSVRAATGAWDPARPTEGACTAFFDFVDGTVASLVYSGFDHFDSREFQRWRPDDDPVFVPPGSARGRLRLTETDAASPFDRALDTSRSGRTPFGITIVSCTDGDLQPWADGCSVMIYGNDGTREIPVAPSNGIAGRAEVLDELQRAVAGESPAQHDGTWGRQTLAVCLALLRSARERREVTIDEMTT